ncbi:MAG: CDP-glycerol glycerophosphotransferase family protein [Candidatus Marinimicrobia bacterium]|nr:CDP-glycerol glycerophosphotransferase family protein [Candidatus Neomarinimicrobiota bacterium]
MIHPYKIVFDAYHLYHLPQFDPIIDLLKSDDRFEVYLTTSAATDPSEQNLAMRVIQQRCDRFILADNETLRAQKVRALNPDVFICGWSRYPIKQFVADRTLVGMVYHGIGVKPSYWRDNSARLDVRFVEGPFRIEQLRNKGIQTDLELTGLAKLDPLFNGSLDTPKSALEKFGLDPAKKTVLYAPTFYPSSFEVFGLKLPEMLQDYNLIIKLHQWSYYLKRFSGVNLRKHVTLIRRIKRKFPEVVVIEPEHYNIVDLYNVADVLVTEASSTIYEFMATRKHVVICDFYKKKLGHRFLPNRIFRRRLDQDMFSNMTDFCYHLSKPKNLPALLDKCFDEPDPFIKIREKYIADMLYLLDGKVSQRICDAILRRLLKTS